MSQSIAFALPWPPSNNHYWLVLRKGKLAGQVIISTEGKQYRKAVADLVLEGRIPAQRLTGKLAVWIHVLPPNNLRRDLDNLPKAVLDSLSKAGVIRDDCDIDDLRITRFGNRTGGELQIRISEIPGKATVSGELFPKEVSCTTSNAPPF